VRSLLPFAMSCELAFLVFSGLTSASFLLCNWLANQLHTLFHVHVYSQSVCADAIS
jgi:hypothetical protein